MPTSSRQLNYGLNVNFEADNDVQIGKDGRPFQLCVDPSKKRLWINAEDGSAVARFNTATGVDVHNRASDQMSGAPECLWCTHGKPDHQTWLLFIEAVDKYFGIKVPADSVDI